MDFMKRRVGEMIRIRPSALVDPATPIGQVFDQSIGLLLIEAEHGAARFVIYADERVLVVEDEVVAES